MEQANDIIATLQVGGMAVYPLVALALLAAVVILEKGFVHSARTQLPAAVVALVEAESCDCRALEARLAALGQRNYPASFLAAILSQRDRPAWWLESRAADAARLVEQALERWLWILETIVTAAPLLGLLGTITGMVRAFHLFGDQGLVDPGGVTGGVAEALIATAIGLFVALVALFAYNFFSQRQARLMDEMERLGTRLVDRIRLERGEAPGAAPGPATTP